MRGTGHWYHGRAQVIAANVSLDIDAGKLRPVLSYFGWNTKMIFASVLVDFASPTSNENQIVCWDDIILESEDAVMSYKDLNCESWTQIFDAAKTLDGAKGDLILRYQVIPWVGVMHTFSVVVKDKVDFSAAPKPRQKQPAKPKKARS
nr:Signal peptidase complex subunit 3 [Polyrhizophydium stewartii]